MTLKLKLLPGVTKKWQIPVKLIGTVITLGILLYYRNLFFGPSTLINVPVVVPLENHRTAVFFVLLVLAVVSGLDGLRASYGIHKTEKTSGLRGPLELIFWLAITFLNSILSFLEVELINNYYFYSMEFRYIVLGVGITFLFYLFFLLITDSASIGLTIGNCFFLAWAMVNYYVQSFRGIPLQWIDFGSFKTAMHVSGNYTYTPTWQIIACLILTICVCGFLLHAKKYHTFRHWIGRVASRAAAVLLLVVFSAVFLHSDFLSNQGVWLRDWQPWFTYRLFGMETGFLAFARASYPEAPVSYSEKHVKNLISKSEKTEQAKGSSDEKADSTDVIPENIICIMNESFSDLSVYPNFKTNVEMLPHLNALKDNTQQGRLMVSVKGGTTANTEYEFLTGNSTVLSPSTVVYNSFIKQNQYSLARTLTSQGYTAYALHPYYRNGWNREIVYPMMGFKDFFSMENSFDSPQYLRGFIDDSSDYDQLIEEVEQKKKGEKLFLFNVTMQNHSPYTDTYLAPQVSLPDYNGVDKAKAEQYLTLTQISDEAVQKLIDYFKKSDEKTLICFWGDHQPEIGDDFWKYCLGKSLDQASFEEQQLTYETRYFIWANYDIPEKENQTLSANYLSSYLLSLTGLKSTGYEQYLMNLRNTIPAMNAYGYLGTDGKQHEWGSSDAGKTESSELEDYKCLIYNELTAGKDRDAGFFGISGTK